MNDLPISNVILNYLNQPCQFTVVRKGKDVETNVTVRGETPESTMNDLFRMIEIYEAKSGQSNNLQQSISNESGVKCKECGGPTQQKFSKKNGSPYYACTNDLSQCSQMWDGKQVHTITFPPAAL